MKKNILFGLTLLLAAFGSALQGFTEKTSAKERIEGNHQVITQTRIPSAPFSEVKLKGSFIVTVTLAGKDSIQLEGESNILPYVSTRVENNRLVLSTEDHISIVPHSPVKVHVFARNIALLEVSGSGSMQSGNLRSSNLILDVSGSGNIKSQVQVDNLKASVSGSGNIEVSGKTVTSNLAVSGSGNIKAYMLEQQKCSAAVSGSGNINVDVRQSLESKISGSGCIYYKGNPQLNSHISGSGRVKPAT